MTAFSAAVVHLSINSEDRSRRRSIWSKNFPTQFWNCSHFFWNLFSFLSSDLSLEEDFDLEEEPEDVEEEEPEEELPEELEEDPLFNIGLYPPPDPVPAYA